MEEPNHNPASPNISDQHLDRLLDAALARYVAAEPRAGLDQRILANLRAERAQAPSPAWWKWSLVAAAAAALIVAALAWRSGRQSRPVITNDAPTTVRGSEKSIPQLAQQDRGAKHFSKRAPARRVAADPLPVAVAAMNPRLEVFPSPQPLSKQEKLLASYVSEYPGPAALIAEARMEALQRDQAEDLRNSSINNGDSGWQ